ncbi:MAG: periplasmic heavy metal sensor [Candidatus Omnitrophica bacterium]|nr:periplasmic heavy metal sensor [Candidatus Omnitrophota bacterium]
MRTIMNKAVAIAVVMALILSAGPVCAYEGRGPEGMGKERYDRGGKFEKISENLGLSAEQKEQLKKDREATLAKTKELKEKIQAARKDLKAELEKPAPDMARVNGTVTQLKDLMGQQIQARVDKVISLRKILTPEQFKKMQDLIEEKKDQYKEKAGRMGRSRNMPRRRM